MILLFSVGHIQNHKNLVNYPVSDDDDEGK